MTAAPPAYREIRFTVQGRPAPQGSKRIGRAKGTGKPIVLEDSKRTRPWRALVQDRAEQAIRDQWPLDGPLRLDVTFYLARPTGHWGTGRNVFRLKPSAPPYPSRLGRDDLSKLVRAVEDACTNAKVWADDAQVVELVATKRWCPLRHDPEGVHVTVSTVTGITTEGVALNPSEGVH